MNRDDLLALAARAEEATGADREADAEIAWLVQPPERRRLNLNPVQRECLHLGLQPPQWVPWDSVASFHPAYTSSLDAALTLVPQGWGCHVATESRRPIAWALRAGAFRPHRETQ